MEKIGVLCASDTELAPFLDHIRPAGVMKKAMLEFYEGRMGRADVVAAYSGVCKVNAAVATQLMIDIFHVTAVINAGTAGGMDENVQLFDTVIGEKMLYHDVAEDILTQFHPWLQENCFRADAGLLEAARQYSLASPFPIRFGIMATGEQFIEDEKRAEINRKYAPLSVDMETAAVAHVCHVNGVPFLAVRTVTDTAAHQGIGNFDQNCETASGISAKIVLGILEHVQSML